MSDPDTLRILPPATTPERVLRRLSRVQERPIDENCSPSTAFGLRSAVSRSAVMGFGAGMLIGSGVLLSCSAGVDPDAAPGNAVPDSEVPAPSGPPAGLPGTASDGAETVPTGATSNPATPAGDDAAPPGPTGGALDSPGGTSETTGQGTTATQAAAQCATLGTGVHAGATKLRRMTQAQFDNTVRDLIGIAGRPASAFSPDERIGPFQSNAIAAITPLLVQQHDEVALDLAEQAVARMDEISPCDLESGGETCTAQFISDFGLRAYRRPLDADEQSAYESLLQTGLQEGGAPEAFRLVVATMLASPNFIYHIDVGTAGTPSNEPVPLTSYELASRLSYFLWNTMPDATLFELAENEELQNDATLEAQVERLLANDRAKDAIPHFHLQWLGINTLDGIHKDEAMFPAFGPDLTAAMTQETVDFTDYVVREGDGSMGTLFTGGFSFLQEPLFELYGMEPPPGFTPGAQVTLDPAQRVGVLTQAAFLARHAHENQTSPVHRGIVIRENLLCTPIQSPPPDVNNVPPQPTEATTTRERFARHSSDPTCAGCHLLMDPIGLGLENYDPVGAWRTRDGLSEVDAKGEFLGTNDPALSGAFVGGVELSQRLADSQQVAECLANQWFRFALGRIESNDDACTMQQLHEGFTASDHNIRELLKKIAKSDAFRHVRYVGQARQETMQ